MMTAASARETIRGLVVDAVHEARDAGGTIYAAGELAADRIVEGLDGLFAGEDLSGAWVELVTSTRPVYQGPTVLALARALERDESTPPALQAIASAYLRSRVTDHPNARLTDLQTSRAAGEKVRGPIAAGGKAHRVLAGYGAHAVRVSHASIPHLTHPLARKCAEEVGLTAREVEDRYDVPAAHKRTSELVKDGLLEVVRVIEARSLDDLEEVQLTRDGGRVLRITTFGRQELDRLNSIQGMIPLEE